ncbi:MAG: hypothetical protein DYH06_08845 [Acidobacteria bacterium ACB2]|nr:hypothetical protein [Acidobacteria bacterium ACB2]
MRGTRLLLLGLLGLLGLLPGAGLGQRFEAFPLGDTGVIQALAVTPDGIAFTRGRSLPPYLFRPDTGRFEPVPLGAPPGYAPDWARDICTATDGSLWGATGAYLFRRGAGDPAVTYPEATPGTRELLLGCRGNGEVWTSRGSGLYRYAADGRALGKHSDTSLPQSPGRMWGCPDGNLWMTSGLNLVRLSRENAATQIPAAVKSGDILSELACASDGGAWYTVRHCSDMVCDRGSLVRLFGNGLLRSVEILEPKWALGVVEGPDGAGWFAHSDGLARVSDDGALVLYPHAGPKFANEIVVGPDGGLWFGDNVAHALTRFVLPPLLQAIPAVVGTVGGSGVPYGTDLVVSNGGTSTAAVTLRYLPSRPESGVAEASVTESLLPGRQLVVGDVLAWLRSKGFSFPGTGNVGILSVETEGALPQRALTAFARTTSPSGPGRAGVAYPSLWQESLPSAVGTTLRLFGLRQNAADRTNLAFVNLSRTAPLLLAVTVISGDGTGRRAFLPDVSVGPRKWTQLDSVLASADGTPPFTQGWVEVESVGDAPAPFWAYAVVNHNATNDGTYFSPAEPAHELIVPALVDTGSWRSELVLANPCCSAATAELTFAPGGATPRTVRVPLALLEQRIVANANENLGLGPGVGPLLVRFFDDRGRPAAGVASVRVATPEGYGVSLPGTPLVDLKASKVRVAGQRQGNGVRSNLALVSAEPDATLTLKVTIVDGETGTRKEPVTVTLPPLGFKQLDQVLTPHGISQGWAEVERTATTSATGSGRFLAYGVLNDGERPGEGTGDGSILPMATEK